MPDDAAQVIIAGPKKPLLATEIDSLKQYLQKGGKLLVMLDPYQDGGLNDFLQGYGVELHDDIVIDKLSRVFGGSFLMPVVTQYGPHKITDGFNIATFYPEARSDSSGRPGASRRSFGSPGGHFPGSLVGNRSRDAQERPGRF